MKRMVILVSIQTTASGLIQEDGPGSHCSATETDSMLDICCFACFLALRLVSLSATR